ncbi:MAG: hypothetical protein ACREQW_20715 [Candidatus Binatia bacterium]
MSAGHSILERLDWRLVGAALSVRNVSHDACAVRVLRSGNRSLRRRWPRHQPGAEDPWHQEQNTGPTMQVDPLG